MAGIIRIQTSEIREHGLVRLEWQLKRPEKVLRYYEDGELVTETTGDEAIEAYYKILE